MNSSTPLADRQLERLARKRAGMRLGWLVHAMAYVAVNLLLVALSVSSGRGWAIYPLLGWGLGLALHGAVVLLASPGAGLYQRLLQQERNRLTLQRDPW
ncbi:MAG: 2TM domain-containing protein [Ramlibacter sp.]|nr:2TM domain-containing protein [Ramlibacter sp.]MBX3658865.1 2TM domain-containing protein [Ramlibacter sp.]MCW5649496.1 2TM domain-containing protein [Ramlibacter sp.]